MIAMLIFDWLDNVVHALAPGDLNEWEFLGTSWGDEEKCVLQLADWNRNTWNQRTNT